MSIPTSLKNLMKDMDEIKSFKDLIVWQKSIKMTEDIYILTRQLPSEEAYGLVNQMRRAAVSIPSNIAEGQQRDSKKEFVRFLSMARGSNGELQTQCYICVRLGYFNKEQVKPVMSLLSEISKMLNSLIKKLSTE